MRAAADDHDVVAVAQLAGAGATSAAGGRSHARDAPASTSMPTGPPPRCSAASATTSPHVLAECPADQHQQLVLGLAQQVPGRARDRAGTEAADRRRRLADVDRAEARQQLAPARPDERQRREPAGDIDRHVAPASSAHRLAAPRPAGSPSTSTREGVTGHHQVAVARAMPGERPAAHPQTRTPASRRVAVQLELAHARAIGEADRLVDPRALDRRRRRTRPRRSSRRGARTARRPRVPGAPSACGRGPTPSRVGVRKRERAHERSSSPCGS